MPIMLAQAIPNPAIGTKSMYLFSICGNQSKAKPAINKQTICTFFGLNFLANHTNANADKKVTTLYHPFTNPAQPTASSYKVLFSEGLVFHTDWAMLFEAFCQ